MFNWNVGNINGPCLIWSINYSISQKIWTYFACCIRLERFILG